MKTFLALMVLMLATGLSEAFSQKLSKEGGVDVAATHDFMDHVLEDDFQEDEIVDMDDALQKARILKAMARMVAEAEAMDLMKPKKRFLNIFTGFGPAKIPRKLDCSLLWELTKKEAFKNNKHADFDAVVRRLKKFISHDTSYDDCVSLMEKHEEDTIKSVRSVCKAITTCYDFPTKV